MLKRVCRAPNDRIRMLRKLGEIESAIARPRLYSSEHPNESCWTSLSSWTRNWKNPARALAISHSSTCASYSTSSHEPISSVILDIGAYQNSISRLAYDSTIMYKTYSLSV